MLHAVQPGAFLVVRFHHRPGSVGGVGVEEHRFFRLGVIVPLVEGSEVDGRELPLLQWVGLAGVKAAALFLSGDGEPALEEPNAIAHQHAFEARALAHEFQMLVRGAETHDPLHVRAVVSGAVEQHDFTGGGQVLDIALEIPLGLLALGRLLQPPQSGHNIITSLLSGLRRMMRTTGSAAGPHSRMICRVDKGAFACIWIILVSSGASG